VEQLGRGEPDPLDVDLNQTPLSREVCPVCIRLAVFLAVVFMDPTSTNHPEISPRHKVAPFVVDLLLRLDLDVRDDMQQTQD
jgi:hypothetical protein